MTGGQKADAAERRRRRDLVIATAKLKREQDARTYGVIAFHLQAGRIVRVELQTSEKLSG